MINVDVTILVKGIYLVCKCGILSVLAEPWSNKGGTLVKVSPGLPELNIVEYKYKTTCMKFLITFRANIPHYLSTNSVTFDLCDSLM